MVQKESDKETYEGKMKRITRKEGRYEAGPTSNELTDNGGPR